MMLVGTLVQLGFTVWVVNKSCRGCFHGDSVAADAGFVSGRIISWQKRREDRRDRSDIKVSRLMKVGSSAAFGHEVTGLGHWGR